MAVLLTIARGRSLGAAAAFVVLSFALAPAFAQRVAPEVPTLPGGAGTGGAAGVGGGAGLTPAMPELRSAPMAAPMPQVAPAAPAAPAATPAPAVPAAPAAPIIKFRCQLEPNAEACRNPDAADGGGDSDDCDCSRDYCYEDPNGTRYCQKQQ